MPTYTWTCLEVGYATQYTRAPRPTNAFKDFFSRAFREPARDRWATGGTTTIDGPPQCAEDDTWVAAVLRHELEAARNTTVAPEAIHIRSEHDRCLFVPANSTCFDKNAPESDRLDFRERIPTGRPGVVCQLRGRIWIDKLSFRLVDEHGDDWRTGDIPPEHYAVATLTWECRD